MKRCLISILWVVLWISPAHAQTPICDELTGRQRGLADTILSSEYLYDCCDGTISACLAEEPACSLARRLADNVCRRVESGQDEAQIRRALSRRARSMVGGGAPMEIDLEAAPVLGPDDAPVTVVIYACARCPFCSRLIPELIETESSGPLHERVRFAFRIFPIRGHDNSTAAGLAFQAAAELDAFSSLDCSLDALREAAAGFGAAIDLDGFAVARPVSAWYFWLAFGNPGSPGNPG